MSKWTLFRVFSMILSALAIFKGIYLGFKTFQSEKKRMLYRINKFFQKQDQYKKKINEKCLIEQEHRKQQGSEDSQLQKKNMDLISSLQRQRNDKIEEWKQLSLDFVEKYCQKYNEKEIEDLKKAIENKYNQLLAESQEKNLQNIQSNFDDQANDENNNDLEQISVREEDFEEYKNQQIQSSEIQQQQHQNRSNPIDYNNTNCSASVFNMKKSSKNIQKNSNNVQTEAGYQKTTDRELSIRGEREDEL